MPLVVRLNERNARKVEGLPPQRTPLIIGHLPEGLDGGFGAEVVSKRGITEEARIGITGEVLNLPSSVPAHVLSLVEGIMLHGLVPLIQVLSVTAHVEGFDKQGPCVFAGTSESLAAVHKLPFSAGRS